MNPTKSLILSILILSMISSFVFSAEKADNSPQKALNAVSRGETIRIYIAEPISRYNDYQGHVYENGLLDIPLMHELSLDPYTVWDTSIVWDVNATSFGSISATNIMAFAALFDTTGVLSTSVPGESYYYMAHFVDASTSALPDNPGRNKTGAYTHSVFIEEATRPG